MGALIKICLTFLLLLSPTLAQPDLSSEFLDHLGISTATARGKQNRAQYLLFLLPEREDAFNRLKNGLADSGWEFERKRTSKTQNFQWLEPPTDNDVEGVQTKLVLQNVTSRSASRVRGMGCDILYEKVTLSMGTVVNELSPYFGQRVLVVKQSTRIG